MSQIALLTIGYPGNGKSATANTILGYDAFSKNNSTAKIVTEPSVHTSTDKTITVVDGLCLMGLDEDTLFDAQTAVQMCGGSGLSSVLVVLRFGEKFSEEEAKLVDVARNVFGPNILRDFGVCLVTHGDDFKYAVDEGEEDSKTLDGWCQKQRGKLRALFSECGNRCVMFDNRTKDPKEKGRLLSIVRNLSKNGSKRYTIENFHKLHRRAVPMSHNKQLQMTFRRRLEGIRGKLQSDPSAYDFERMLKELRDISEEATQAFQDKEYIQTVIHEAQVLTKSIKSLQEKYFLLSNSDQIVDTQTKTGASGQATVQDFDPLTFDTEYFRQVSQKKADSEKVYNDLLEKNVRQLDTNHKPPALSAQAARSKHEVNAEDEPKAKSIQPLDDISILIVGRSGNGKSSTGNSILGGREFQINSATTSTKSSVQSQRKKVGNLGVLVVDGPSLEDVALNASTNLDEMLGSFKEALQQCDYSFNGVAVVLKFGQRFTKQEKDAIVMIKSILGKEVLRKYGVCVMTYGDNFDNEMEGNDRLEFIDWCRQQTGEIADLFEECSYRCVLFDNKTQEDEVQSVQRGKLFNLINTQIRYSEDEFVEAEEDFKELSIQCAIPLLEQATNTILAHVREKMLQLELEAPRDSETYKRDMESLLQALQQYKTNIESLGHHSSTIFQIQLIDTVQLQINSKLRLCQQTEELKQLDVAKQNLLGTPSIGFGAEENGSYLDQTTEFVGKTFNRWSLSNQKAPTDRLKEKQSMIRDIDRHLKVAARRSENNKDLDHEIAKLIEMKEKLTLEVQAEGDHGFEMIYPHPVQSSSNPMYPSAHRTAANTAYNYGQDPQGHFGYQANSSVSLYPDYSYQGYAPTTGFEQYPPGYNQDTLFHNPYHQSHRKETSKVRDKNTRWKKVKKFFGDILSFLMP
ncbi:GTPase IMAP family member [Biomphalaria glabrata]|nr:GTPase IMAP family member [Biomphalaria glabrata]